MARPRKPASLKAGKSETKAHLEERHEKEMKLKGESNLIYNIPKQLDSLAIEYYKFLIDELESSEILSNLDVPLLTQTADCLSKMEQVDDVINREGMFYDKYDAQGNAEPKEHPAVGTKQKYLNQFRALSTQLGLSPSSRANLAEAAIQKSKEQKDPVLQILEGLKNREDTE